MITNSLEAAVVERSAQRPEPAVEVRGLRKAYGSVQAGDGIDLAVQRGEVLAILGPNGAGKTSTVEILEGHRRADAGHVEVLGFDPAQGERALLDRIGIVLQSGGLPPALTVAELLEMHARWYSRPRDPRAVIELVELGEARNVNGRPLSGGQRPRLAPALGLIGAPELLFLDEPTTGF